MGRALCGLQLPFQVFIIIYLFGKLESAKRPVVTFLDLLDWNKILLGENKRMTCNAEPEATLYHWYHNDIEISTGKNYDILSARIGHSGQYKCSANIGGTSEIATLIVSAGPVILQASLYIYEGDDIFLRCNSPPERVTTLTTFYRNNEIIQESATDNLLFIGYKDLTASYKCSKKILITNTYSAETTISYTVNAGTIPVTVTPGWNKLLTGESTTMTCHGDTYETYQWFLNGNFVTQGSVYTITSAQVAHSGFYQCQTSRGNSAIFRLDVSNGPLILRAPVFVYPGRDINLNCHSRPGYPVHRTTFYKDNNVILGSSIDPSFAVLNGRFNVSGRYRCERELSWGKYETYTDEASLLVRDLFSKPNIISRNITTEGDTMTLICNTSLSPLRQGTELQFAFYRDGEEVQKRSSSHQYEVYSAQIKDSGNYSCEVRNNSVIKQSKEFYIQIEEKNTEPQNSTLLIVIILAILLFVIIITVIVIVIKYRHKTQPTSSREPTMDLPEESSKGFNQEGDACYAEINDLRKESPKGLNQEGDMCYAEINHSMKESQNGLNLEGDVCYAKINHSQKASSLKAPEKDVVYSEIKAKK